MAKQQGNNQVRLQKRLAMGDHPRVSRSGGKTGVPSRPDKTGYEKYGSGYRRSSR